MSIISNEKAYTADTKALTVSPDTALHPKRCQLVDVVSLTGAYEILLRRVFNQRTRELIPNTEMKRHTEHTTRLREAIDSAIAICQPSDVECITTCSEIHNATTRDYFEKEGELFDQWDRQSLPFSLLNKITTPDGRVHSNEGYHVLHIREVGDEKDSKTQWEWIKERLVSCQDTDQAILQFLRPFHQSGANSDQLCATNLQFMIRDNYLHLFANTHTNDVVYGTPYNLMYFTRLMHRMLRELRGAKYPNLQLGNLTHRATSLYMNEAHVELVKDMLGKN